MNKRLLTVLLVGLCTLVACSNDEKITYVSPLPEDGSACTVADFKNQCRTDTSYMICENDQVVTKNCVSNQVCLGGECKNIAVQLQQSCDPASFVPVCSDEKHRTFCSEDGQSGVELCAGELKCSEGACVEESSGGQADCTDVGCRCDARKYRSSCDNDKRLACDVDVITETDSAAYVLTCYEGECVDVISTECDEKFKDVCIGNRHVYCDDGEVKSEDCYGDDERCLTINGSAACYSECLDEGRSYYRCLYDENGTAQKSTCTLTENGLFEVWSDETCFACLNPSDNGGFDAQIWDVAQICLSKECTAGPDKCEDNHVISCRSGDFSKGYELDYDCGDKSCVVYDDDAICADECTAELAGQHQRQCLEYGSTDFICTQIGDKYYWIYNDREPEMMCHHGCNEETGECIKIHPDEYKPCSLNEESDDYYAPKCDNNVGLACYSDYVSASECDGTCLMVDDNPGCYNLCSDEEINHPTYECDGDSGSYFDGCVEIVPGKFVHRSRYIHCQNGCDETTGQCVKIHEDEGKKCDVNGLQYCSGDIELSCDNGIISAYACNPRYSGEGSPVGAGETYACVEDIADDAKYAHCMLACTEADAERIETVCTDSYDGGWLEGRRCVKSVDMGYHTMTSEDYFWSEAHGECEHGCNEAHNDCLMLHDDEGKRCDPEKDLPRCGNENLLLVCNSDHRWAAEDCRGWSYGTVSCSESVDGYAKCDMFCTKEDYEKKKVETFCHEDEVYSYRCMKMGDENYIWYNFNSTPCTGSCNEVTKTCNP